MKPIALRHTVAVYQAVGPQQLAALIRTDWRCIEPGWAGEHFTYLKQRQRYAEMIARQWEVPLYGAGYVVRLVLPEDALRQYDLEPVAYAEHLEYRVPSCELRTLSRELVGAIQPVAAFMDRESYSIPLGSRPLASLIG